MDSNTGAQMGMADKMAQLFSQHISDYMTEHPEANIGDVEAMMRQELQTIGRRSMEMALTASDQSGPAGLSLTGASEGNCSQLPPTHVK